MTEQITTSFSKLNPDEILRGLEVLGFRFSGLWQPLNSYENRVIKIQTADGEPWILKLYRPGRWGQNEIQEEHDFLLDLAESKVPVASPWKDKQGKTLWQIGGFFACLFPLQKGQLCSEISPDDLYDLGSFMAQVHAVGRKKKFKYRQLMNAHDHQAWNYLNLLRGFVYPDLIHRYEASAKIILSEFENWVAGARLQRIHGDLHRGNLLKTEDDFILLDFDDCCEGPIVQDGWMLFSGDDDENERLAWTEGYENIAEFPQDQWSGVRWLRGYRIIQSSAWIARRWQDPNFPSLFSRFREFNYWAEEVEALERLSR